MILDLDAPLTAGAWPRWRSFAALALLFAAALAAAWTTTRGTGTSREQGLAWLASLQDRFAPAPTEAAQPSAPPSVFDEPVVVAGPLGFPSRVATLLSRRSLAGTTGLISAGEADRPMIQSSYRLLDGRRVVLLQLAPRSSALAWSGPYTREPIEVRGFAATLDSPESRGQPVVLSWSEGRAVYQLYSTDLSASELAVLAAALR